MVDENFIRVYGRKKIGEKESKQKRLHRIDRLRYPGNNKFRWSNVNYDGMASGILFFVMSSSRSFLRAYYIDKVP